MIPITTIDDRNPPITEITTKSATEIVFSSPNATEIALARTASTNETDSDIEIAAGEVLADDACRAGRDMRKVPVWIGGAQPAAERAEDVAAHADGGGDEHEQAGEGFEGAGDRAERQPGEQVTARAEQERVRSPLGPRRRPSATARESARRPLATTATWVLGGSFISSLLKRSKATRLSAG